MPKTKIVLDADVIIHFAEAKMLSLLPNIFKGYDFVVLDDVYREINEPLKTQLDNHMALLGTINRVEFAITGDIRKEMAKLTSPSGLALGRGESACMLYCKHNHDVVGSSNVRDIKEYCEEHMITYLTTFDFLYYAIKNSEMTVVEAQTFVQEVKSLGGRLPNFDIGTYISDKIL